VQDFFFSACVRLCDRVCAQIGGLTYVHMNNICVSARVFTYIMSYQDKLRSTMNESNGAENLHRPVYMHAPGFMCIHVLDYFLNYALSCYRAL